jgi:hypothetical protein
MRLITVRAVDLDWVSPFRSKCTRISVSGNVHDSAPLNNIVNFGPEYLKDRAKRVKKNK